MVGFWGCEFTFSIRNKIHKITATTASRAVDIVDQRHGFVRSRSDGKRLRKRNGKFHAILSSVHLVFLINTKHYNHKQS